MRHAFVFVLSVFLLHFKGVAQVDHFIETDQYKLDTVAVLIDKGYNFEDILTNPDLEFTKQTKISVEGITHYWTKCKVSTNFAYDKTFAVWTTPPFDIELFYFDENKAQWQSVKGGVLIADRSIPKYVPCIFKADETTTFYTKVNVSEVNQSENELNVSLYFQDENLTKANREKDFYWWLGTVVIVLAFLIYNLYWYMLIREKV